MTQTSRNYLPSPQLGRKLLHVSKKIQMIVSHWPPPSFLRACTIIDCDETDVFLAGGGIHAFLGFDSWRHHLQHPGKYSFLIVNILNIFKNSKYNHLQHSGLPQKSISMWSPQISANSKQTVNSSYTILNKRGIGQMLVIVMRTDELKDWHKDIEPLHLLICHHLAIMLTRIILNSSSHYSSSSQ